MRATEELKRRAGSYLGGQTSLREFEEWIVLDGWGHEPGSLVVEIDCDLMEMSAGIIGEREFRRRLQQRVGGR